jgi:hypothetical protein
MSTPTPEAPAALAPRGESAGGLAKPAWRRALRLLPGVT